METFTQKKQPAETNSREDSEVFPKSCIMNPNPKLKVVVIQIAPIFLDARATWEKLKQWIIKAKKEENADMVCFGETLIPGYPAWLSETGGAKFNDEE